MTVRRLRSKQRGPKCSYCILRADHRGVGFTRFACDTHLDALVAEDRAATIRDSHQSDAEWIMGI